MTIHSLAGDAVEDAGEGSIRFVTGQCQACGNRAFPMPPICSNCQSTDIVRKPVEAAGTVYSLTEVHVGPAEWHRPVRLAYVDLPDGLRVFGHWRGSVGIGTRVRARMGEVGKDAAGTHFTTYVFEPAEASDA
ncbi:Zn-ribbon domain-containing OB-fold protein [Microbaculum marinum]|uniref:OB-fold domain-containing protein n=1 Tax=Microbaculum marinum TaxID=1764581 RepID=A0AAW9RXX3_9HYPH